VGDDAVNRLARRNDITTADLSAGTRIVGFAVYLNSGF
jgi:hypothetical protein